MACNMENCVEISIKDVIGPLPDMSAMIVVEAGGKTFPLRCTLSDAESCYQALVGSPTGPYSFVVSAFEVSGVDVTGTILVERDGALYSSVCMRKGKRNMRIASENPAVAVNFSLYSKRPMTMSESSLTRIKDSSQTYNAVRCEIRTLWPMAPLNKTRELQVMSEYMEDALPDGSSPVTANDDRRPRAG